ncbi:MAG: hypothetical protein QXU18_04630 [Thermoplasmatales archaeon]
MSFHKITFSHIWDKFNDPEFTTIRSWNPGKEEYYRSLLGKRFSVLYKENPYSWETGRLICHASLVQLDLVKPSTLPQALLHKDVTLNSTIRNDWLKKLMNMDKAILLSFSKNSVPSQRTLEVK